MRILIVLLFTIYYLLLTINETLAAPLSLSVSPPLLEITAQPPDEIKAPIQLTNQGEEPVLLEIKLFPFVAKGETGEVEFLNIELPIKNLVTIEEEKAQIPLSQMTLRPKESKTLNLRILLTQDQEAADYYFSIVFLSKAEATSATSKTPADQTIQASSLISSGIAVNVLLSIGEKPSSQNLQVLEFTSPKFLQSGPVSFKVRVGNEGQHFVKPTGKILITNMFGQKIGLLDLPTENILANSVRSYSPIIFSEKLLLGPYTAEFKIDPAKGGVTARTTFYAFPVKQFFGGIALIIVALIIRKRVRRRLGR